MVADFVVSPSGSDSNPGSAERPFRTVKKGLQSVGPGQVLQLRGGTYAEQILNPTVAAGTAQQPIRVVAAAGERPVVQGLLWLRNASYWSFEGVNVTWDAAVNSASQHMVKMTGGTGWTFSGAELWGARSYAALLIAGDATGWRVTGNYIHDTVPSNGTNQDHLIYANSTGGGLIDRNLLTGSPNGRAVKVGPPSATSGEVRDVEIAYNTMYDNLGPSNVQIAWGSYNTDIHHNIMVKPAVNRSAVTAYQLTGTGNTVTDNVYWDAVRVADTGVAGMAIGAGNREVDPVFTGAGTAQMRATSPAAAGYGHTTP